MSWNDHYRRREALDAALDHARTHPSDLPGPETVAAARGIFEDADEMLCALQYTWTQRLAGRLDVVQSMTERAQSMTERAEHTDRLAAVRAAWQRTATANPVLRAVLDEHVDPPAESSSSRLREAVARERRMLARAGGLVEAGDDHHDIVRLGSTVRKLIRLPAPSASRATPRLLASR